jgi:hemolysin-activating ACP:hemolysin acyltransferase
MGMSYKFAGYMAFSKKMLEKSGKKDAYFLLAFMNEDRKIEYLEKYLNLERDKDFGSFADTWTAEAVAKLKTYYQEKLTALEKHGS